MYDVLEGKDMKESSARGGGGCVRVRVRVCFLLLLFFLMLTYRQEPITWPTSIDMVAG